ncbi:RICIN domain-containing protein [Streptomyces sp. ET3-23]|uniref:RICIN domain-containing protein n=1 Tax=Streptomyces sp. ET3-23 TaxID=2885643 RepID=UPI001D12A9B0|nr:RICIN domain-containing protein [Streptomyces sp. ET3-23]MCC2273942.1 RICIN domain-containing protein [Streptomyces sp. ET3-23]
MNLRRVGAVVSGLMLAVAGVVSAPTASAATGVEIRNKHSGWCLGIQGGSKDWGAMAIQWDCNGNDDQKWRYEALGNGYYRLHNVGSNLCLGIRGGSWDRGADVIQWECNGNGDQMWYMPDGGAYYPMMSANNRANGGAIDLCMSIGGGRTDWGAKAIVWDCNGADDQTWS